MSAAKRRVKRKIAMLVRMDATHYWCQRRWPRCATNAKTADRILAGMQAVGTSKWGKANRDRCIAAIDQQRGRMGLELLQ